LEFASLKVEEQGDTILKKRAFKYIEEKEIVK